MDGVSAAELGIDLEDEETQKSLSGIELSKGWPNILSAIEEKIGYGALYDKGEDRTKPPTHIQTERLSYELVNGSKKLRFFAVLHSPKPDELNFGQYDILEKRFNESPPQLVLIEGNIDLNYPVQNKEDATKHGEQYFMSYLVQQHNKNLKEGEQPIEIESGDIPNDLLAEEFKKIDHTDEEVEDFFTRRGEGRKNQMHEEEKGIRDKYIIKNGAKKFENYDRVDIVFGSGHAIREKQAWNSLFE